jgi:SRSO17 transposase
LFTKKFKADEGKYSVLIIDDTAKKKTGKFVEGLSYFYDHSADCYYKGYQVVIAAWSNLRTCIPLDIVLKTGKKRCKHSKRCGYPASSHTHKRHLESRKSKTKIAVAMAKRVLLYRIHIDYVLWDSWYNCSESYIFVFKKLLPKAIHLISMVKQGKELYKYGNKNLTAKQLQAKAGVWQTDKKTGIKYKSLEVEIYDKTDKSKKNKPITGTVRLCFYKFKGKGKRRCRVLLSTDTNLTEMEVLERYTQRWSIEVMIKDLKQHMGFNQSMSSKYAPQLTDMTIKCIFYIKSSSMR